MKDPYRKPYHMAAKINDRGGVSPLCASTPRALDLSWERWTIRKEAVTCRKCRQLLEAQP